MIDKNRCLAIIPARGGSKRIPRKNIRPFLGVPIIKYSIDAALQIGCFEEVMVSTEDKEIAEVAKSLGAKIPFFRSEKTSDDYSTIIDVSEEVILEYKKKGKEFDYFCCIFSTAPFLNAKRLRQGLKLLIESGAEAVVPVVQDNPPIQWSMKIKNNRLKMIWPENYLIRSQDLEKTYYDVGQFFWGRPEVLLKQKKLIADDSVPLIIAEKEAQDIDFVEDWELAELKYKLLDNIV